MKVFAIALILVGLIGTAAVGACAEAQKVVIGVLDIEFSGTEESTYDQKKALMEELKRNPIVKPVNIHETCGLSNLTKGGYERAERYKKMYELDMILHTKQVDSTYYFSLIDLYRKRIKEVCVRFGDVATEIRFWRISKRLLVSQDLNRVLKEKKKAVEPTEVIVPPEIKEEAVPPEITEDLLIEKGPQLISEGNYNRVLDLIKDLPAERRGHIQIQTLECFANLKGWVSEGDSNYKSNWWALRQKLIKSGDNEATPMLMLFLKDSDHWLRKYAAELLGYIGDERALKDLREVGEHDEKFGVRKYARWAYEQIFGERF